ncbi:MAG TPA: hypothetical protein VKR06_22685 [Ktedonosporobacter sp.]|nr:hypothetical protein [Ktedonosporobacter sp.]
MNTLTLVLMTTTNSSSDSLTPAIFGIIGVAIGGLLGIGGNIATIFISSHKQMERDAQAYHSQLEKEKKDRLRQVYAKVLFAGLTLQKALADIQFISGNETVEERNRRISSYLAPVLIDQEKAKVDLMLEESDEEVISTFDSVYRSFVNYNLGLQANSQVPATVTLKEFEAYKNQSNEAINKLKKLLHDRLLPDHLKKKEAR